MSGKILYRLITWLTILLFVNTPLFSQEDEERKDIKIKSIAYKGSGCLEDTVSSDISPDREIFTLSFNDFIVAKEGSKNPFKVSKNCKIIVKFEKPKNWGFKFFSFSLQGSGDLQKRVKAKQSISIKTRDQKDHKPKNKITIKGPYSDDYERLEEFDLKEMGWSACGEKELTLVINTKISVSPFPEKKNNQSGFMSVNLAENRLKEEIGFLWEKCSKRENKFISYCKVPIEKNNKAFKDKLVKSKKQSKKESLLSAMKKAKELCDKFQDKSEKTSCSLEKISCKTEKLN